MKVRENESWISASTLRRVSTVTVIMYDMNDGLSYLALSTSCTLFIFVC